MCNWINRGADVHFRHQSAEVLGIVRQVVEIGRVQVVSLPAWYFAVSLASRITSSDSPPPSVIELL